jgi:hypothetical protein
VRGVPKNPSSQPHAPSPHNTRSGGAKINCRCRVGKRTPVSNAGHRMFEPRERAASERTVRHPPRLFRSHSTLCAALVDDSYDVDEWVSRSRIDVQSSWNVAPTSTSLCGRFTSYVMRRYGGPAPLDYSRIYALAALGPQGTANPTPPHG